ncbi:hypothetical protein FRC09_010506 [Ceratobasidium sp. 395]|nr:hypothetical protein FRC09_010506 [Ceratobasidium sp. 395]
MSESKMLSNVRPRGQKDLSTVKADPEPDYSKSRVLPLSPESALKKIQFEERFKAGDWNADINSSLGADRRALVVSISYGSRSPPSPLQGTYTDAQIIIDLLVQKFDYLESEIHVLADVLVIGDDHKRDESRLPSQKNIENALNWLNRGSKEGDYRFLFCKWWCDPQKPVMNAKPNDF